jgi:hypothetical protein
MMSLKYKKNTYYLIWFQFLEGVNSSFNERVIENGCSNWLFSKTLFQ